MPDQDITAGEIMRRRTQIQDTLQKEVTDRYDDLSRQVGQDSGVINREDFHEAVRNVQERHDELIFDYWHRLLGRPLLGSQSFANFETRLAERAIYKPGDPSFLELRNALVNTTLAFAWADDAKAGLKNAINRARGMGQGRSR